MSILNPLPPSGRGIYDLGIPIGTLARFDFVAVVGRLAGAAEKARQLRSRGVRTWYYSGPDSWKPATWREGRAALLRALESGGEGYIADPEGGWTGPDAAAQAVEMGRALAADAQRLRVGITSYPLWRHRAALAAVTRGACFASPQLYAPDGASVLARRLADWGRLWGRSRVIPSIAAYDTHSSPLNTETLYARYLESLPPGVGYIAWGSAGEPAWRWNMLLAHPPAPIVSRLGLEIAAWITTPIGIVSAIIAVAIFLATIYAIGKIL